MEAGWVEKSNLVKENEEIKITVIKEESIS